MVIAPEDPSVDMPHVIDHPVNVDTIGKVGPRRAPEIGEHTDEILAELGFGAEEIELLRGRGAV